MAKCDTPLTFTVRRLAPELIVPARPTPRELKPVSDIDDQEIIRRQTPFIMVYHRHPNKRNGNPASVIREALAKLLVFYYPFAGRLKEGPAGKLMVDCSGEGVLFIEAEADVTLNQMFPCMDDLLYDVPGSSGIINSPLLLIQVTRMLCGGFIFAIRFNHIMSDATGLIQFLSGLGEIARGAASPSTLPVWQRELLHLTDGSPTTFTHHEYGQVVDTKGTIISLDEMVQKSLFFTTTDILAFRRLVPIHLRSCSTFELLTACLWRCRTIALQPDPQEVMPVVWPINARNMIKPPLPVGYYGNVLAYAPAISTARDLCNKPLGYVLELVMKAKSDVSNIRSVSDLISFKRPPHITTIRDFGFSDLRRVGFDVVDFGWGKPTYGGAPKGGISFIRGLTCLYVLDTNSKGESGIMILIALPSGSMDRFVEEINSMLAQGKNELLLALTKYNFYGGHDYAKCFKACSFSRTFNISL